MDAATYELHLRGALSASELGALEDLGMSCDTLVSGVAHDESELLELLERLRDAGLELVEVRRVADEPSTDRQTGGPAAPTPSATPD